MNKTVEKGSRLKAGDVIELTGTYAMIAGFQDTSPPLRARIALLTPYGSRPFSGTAVVIAPDLDYSVRVEDGPLQLYVWTGFSPDYTDGLAFALAYSEAHARSMIQASYSHEMPIREWGELQVLPLDAPVAFEVSGGG